MWLSYKPTAPHPAKGMGFPLYLVQSRAQLPAVPWQDRGSPGIAGHHQFFQPYLLELG